MNVASSGNQGSGGGPPGGGRRPPVEDPDVLGEVDDESGEEEEEDEELRRLNPKAVFADGAGAPKGGPKDGGSKKRKASLPTRYGNGLGVATGSAKVARTSSGRRSPSVRLGVLGCGYKPSAGSPPYMKLSGQFARKPLDPRQYKRAGKKSTEKKVTDFLESKYHKTGFRSAGNALPPSLEELIRDEDPDAVIARLEQYEEDRMAKDIALQGIDRVEAKLPAIVESRVAQLRELVGLSEADARAIAEAEAATVRAETPKHITLLAKAEASKARLAAEKALKVAQQNMVDAMMAEQLAQQDEDSVTDAHDGGGKPRASASGKPTAPSESGESDDDDDHYEGDD